MTRDTLEQFCKLVGAQLVPDDDPIYQNASWRISFVSRPRPKARAEDAATKAAADDLKEKQADGTLKSEFTLLRRLPDNDPAYSEGWTVLIPSKGGPKLPTGESSQEPSKPLDPRGSEQPPLRKSKQKS